MIEDKDHIDDIFKESSEQHSFEVPDSFLDDINNKLDVLDKKKKRGGGFWWMALIPLGLLIIYALWPNDNQTKKTELLTENHTEKSSKQEEGLNDSIQWKESLTISSEDSLSQNTIIESASASNIVVNSAENSKTLSAFLQEGGKVIGDISDQEKSLWLKEELKKQEEFNSLPSKNDSEIVEPETKEEAFAHSNLEKVTESRISNISATENVQNNEEGVSTNVDDISTNSDDVSNDVDEVLAISDSENTTITEPIEETNSSQIDEVSEIESDQIDSLSTVTEDQDSTLNLEEMIDPSEMMLAGGNREKDDKISHEIQLYGGMLSSSSKLTLSSDSSTFPMNTMESNLWSPSFGLMYRAKINQFDVGAGFSWTKNGEKVNYSTSITQYTDVDSLIFVGWQTDSIFNPNTQTWSVDSIAWYDTLTVIGQANDTVFFNEANKYSWISIPLRFGYRIDVNEYSIIPRVGIDLGFAIGNNTGTYAEQFNQGLVQKSSSQFILSYALQLEVRRNFERWHVFVNPYFRSNVTPVISSAIQTRRYNSWGINAGIGFKLK